MTEETLHVGFPFVGDRKSLQEKFDQVLDRNWLTNDGPMLLEFEEALRQKLGVDHCIAVNNGTMAEQLAAVALNLHGEVILPSFTFIATPHALEWLGITPVFCDIDPDTLCLRPDHVESLVSDRTSAIIGVHVYGRPCPVDALTEIAERHQLRLMFDAAHALGCTYKSRMIGNFGDCEVFSFHATKVLNTIEGGAITTNDGDLADRLRRLRNFGFPGDGREVTIELGINAKMNEFSAAMGLVNLEALDGFVETNQQIFEAYRRELKGIPGIALVEPEKGELHNYQYVVAIVDQESFGVSRDRLVDALQARNILARRYFAPGCHSMAPYSDRLPGIGKQLETTERIASSVVALPTGTQMNAAAVRRVCSAIADARRPAAG